MEVVLVQPPPRVDLVEIFQDPNGKWRGQITRPWSEYLNTSFARQGGNVAPSNDDIAAMIDSASLGVFANRSMLAPSAPDIEQINTFSRPQYSVQIPTEVQYFASFLPRALFQKPPVDEASDMLRIRTFTR